MSMIHHYRATCSWSGDTGLGYEDYVRAHHVTAPPAEQQLELSADPAYRGNPRLLNPEQLVVMAAASCQLLSFLAVAARARVNVLAYEDNAEGEMPTSREAMRITAIRLNPRIQVAAGTSEESVLELVRQAHDSCYIANSLSTEITINATIVFV